MILEAALRCHIDPHPQPIFDLLNLNNNTSDMHQDHTPPPPWLDGIASSFGSGIETGSTLFNTDPRVSAILPSVALSPSLTPPSWTVICTHSLPAFNLFW